MRRAYWPARFWPPYFAAVGWGLFLRAAEREHDTTTKLGLLLVAVAFLVYVTGCLRRGAARLPPV